MYGYKKRSREFYSEAISNRYVTRANKVCLRHIKVQEGRFIEIGDNKTFKVGKLLCEVKDLGPKTVLLVGTISLIFLSLFCSL